VIHPSCELIFGLVQPECMYVVMQTYITEAFLPCVCCLPCFLLDWFVVFSTLALPWCGDAPLQFHFI
uniref:Uncharacterized protein n=1 Tax=Aegilops tauschii subsp. strangulata TaxID=200361 RepID=A0A453MS49_AEGTS